MAVTGVWSSAGVVASDGIFLAGLGSLVGHRLVVVVGERGGGATCDVSADDPLLAAALVQRAERVTLPESTSDRRSVWLWEAIVPAGVASNPRLLITVIDGGDPVEASATAFTVDAGASYLFAGSAAADSGAATTTSQTTGTTGTVPAGDWLVVAGAAFRGVATTSWDLTDGTPPNPDDPQTPWDLSVGSGSGNARREVRAGVAELADQAAGTVSDTLTLDTARMTSALIAVWSTGGVPPDEVTGQGALLAPPAAVAGAGSVAVSGSGAASAPPAAMAGAGGVAVAGAGALAAAGGLLAGQGTVGTPAVSGQGALLAPAASAAGAGTVVVAGAGSVQAAAPVVAAVGAVAASGVGALMATSPRVAGVGRVGSPSPAPPARTLIVPVEARVMAVEAERRVMVA